MDTRNSFLAQIELANKLAKSSSTEKKRIALILLDNLIEISIKRAVNNLFWHDKMSWDENRRISADKRKKILGYYKDLINFAYKNSIISEDEKIILPFIHDIRNELYHHYYMRNDKLIEFGILVAVESQILGPV